MSAMWMVRAGRGGENVDDFLREGFVGFGDGLLGELSTSISKEELLKLYAQHFPEEKEGSRASWTSQLLRLLTEVKIGDDVITFDREGRRYLIGKICGEYRFNGPEKTAHIRSANWTAEAPRDLLSEATRNTLGSVLTIFQLGAEVARDVLSRARPIGAFDAASEGSLADLEPRNVSTRVRHTV